jgi:hypothetical protein
VQRAVSAVVGLAGMKAAGQGGNDFVEAKTDRKTSGMMMSPPLRYCSHGPPAWH